MRQILAHFCPQNTSTIAKNTKICYNRDMDLFFIIILTAIFAETSFLSCRQFSRNTLRGGRIARRRVFVDTSALMDGRILAVAKAGFLGDELLIPRSVIRELQLLADGSDAEKRARARYGLDVVNELERIDHATVRVFADEAGNRIKVDERLLELAKENQGIILTNDFNLSKVAATEHIYAININELAQGLRSEYLPGDHLSVRVIGAGSNPKQGIAYLPDGTMVVVDDGEKYVGKSYPVEIEFVRYFQTNAGKMMFAKIIENKPLQVKPQILPKKKSTPAGTKKPAKKPIKKTEAPGEAPKETPKQPESPRQSQKKNDRQSPKKRIRKSRESKAEDSLIRIANQ